MQISPVQITSLHSPKAYNATMTRQSSQLSFGNVRDDIFFKEDEKPKEGLEATLESLRNNRINAMEAAKDTKAFWGRKKIKIQKILNAINEHALALEMMLRGQEKYIKTISHIVEGSNELVAKILPNKHANEHNEESISLAEKVLKSLNGGKPLEDRITELRNARNEEMDKYQGWWNERTKKDVAVAEVAVEKHISVLEDMIRGRDGVITLILGIHENYEHLISGALDNVPHINAGEIIGGLASGGVSNAVNSGIRVIK